MNMTQLFMMQQMLTESQDKQEEQRPSPVVIACYGCGYMCASPISCSHPSTIAIRWDMYNDRSYRVPSIEGCIKQSGACQFFEPDEKTGLGYSSSPKAQRKVRGTKIDSVLDKLDDDNCNIHEFLKDLQNLDEELNREDGLIDDKGDVEVESTTHERRREEGKIQARPN
jgi:hypothetical protein